MSSFLALVKDDLLTLYLGKVLGFQALGYIGWAKNGLNHLFELLWTRSPEFSFHSSHGFKMKKTVFRD